MSGFSGMTAGDLRVDEDATVSGMIDGTLTVAAGRRVTVSGMVNGALIVEPGAEVHVTGMVCGGIDDRGGRVSVTGMVTR